MSRAFVKEDAATEELPERLVSPHPNLVTAEGLAAIEQEVDRLAKTYAAAQVAGDRDALNMAARDLRYWTQRRASAEVVEPVRDGAEVRFGSSVTIERTDGRRQTFRIVGEDEADPARFRISYVSPLARALMGKAVGDIVVAGAGEAEIVGIA